MIVFDAQVNDAIIEICSASLLSKFFGPLVRRVAPVAYVFFFTPRVSQLDKSITSGKLNDANYNVCMSKNNASFACHGVIAATSSSLNDIVCFVILFQRIPQFVCSDALVINFIDGRGIDDIPDSGGRPAANSVSVVTVELSKNLLIEGSPQGFVFARVREIG